MTRILTHFRANLVGYLALFVALGGTSYAAVELPHNSVGSAQIRNNSIPPVKLNSRYTSGEIRAWARVNAAGKVVGGGHGIIVQPQGSVAGDYLVSPTKRSKAALPKRCAIVASVDDDEATPGFADGEVATFPGLEPRWQAVIATFDAQGEQVSLPFDFVVVC